MTSRAVLPARRRLDDISPRAWEHLADRAALRAMQSIPGFDEVLRKIVGAFGERGIRLALQSNAVRVSDKQFPRLHRLWLGVQDTLDAPEEYPLYVSQSPFVNAGTFGIDRPWVVLYSGSLTVMTDAEIEFVMGHELGHVLSGHGLYHTMMEILISLAASNFPLVGLAAAPVLLALKEWYRKSEISGDRAGLLAVQNPDAAMRTMMRLAGGGRDEEMDLGEFLIQAEEYRQSGGALDQVFKVLATLNQSHPFLVLRAALVRDWIEEGHYDRALRGDYPRRGDTPPGVAEEVAAGVRHYAAGMEETAARAGETLRRVRDAFGRGFKGPDAGPPDA
jgi:Zn-dependent protease with chaperone function